jgi:TM2 domain-containing membrane protein YozV
MKRVKILIFLLCTVWINSLSAAFPVETQSVETTIVSNETTKDSKKLVLSQIKKSTVVDAPTMASPASGKSQLVALLLVIFVGALGIHRFYLGYTTIGIIQLLTLGGFGIWALIDLIMIATGSLKPKDGEYTTTL